MFTQTHLTSGWGHTKTCMRKWRRCKRYQNENPEARKIGCHIPERIWFLICMGCKIMQSEGVPHFTRGATRIRSQISPALQPNSERFQQGSRTVPVFRGVHFRVIRERERQRESIYTHIYIYIYICIDTYMYIYIRVHMCINIITYMYMYMYSSVFQYVQTYIQNGAPPIRQLLDNPHAL